MFIDALFEYTFLQHALIAGLLIGVICPVIGAFIVVRRLSLVADALSHVAFSGIAVAFAVQSIMPVFTWLTPTYTGMAFSVGGAFFIKPLMSIYRFYQEFAIPIILSAAAGLGLVAISLAEAFNQSLFAYLFGSLLTVSSLDIWIISVISLVVVAVITLIYRPLVQLSFDGDDALLALRIKRFVSFIFILLVALVIAASMTVIGILLVSAMITLPIAGALRLTKSFKGLFGYGILLAELEIISGLIISYQLDWSTGGTIVLCAFVVMMFIILFQNIMSSLPGMRRVYERTDKLNHG